MALWLGGSWIIPARAGSTSCRVPDRGGWWDHPRSRGEHDTWSASSWKFSGSSPLARGALGLARLALVLARIIPARAGSTRRLAAHQCRCWDHPRSRGEHPIFPFRSLLALGSSPLARGARGTAPLLPGLPRIIPARAGSTT